MREKEDAKHNKATERTIETVQGDSSEELGEKYLDHPTAQVPLAEEATREEEEERQRLCRARIRRRERLKEHGIELEDVRVGFSDIFIREYPITIGDNPGGLCGPPLTIEWQHQAENRLAVDDYEKSRPNRRRGREMIMPSNLRVDLLKGGGFSRGEIAVLTRSVNISRTQRRRTIQTLHLAPFQEISEAICRTTSNMFSLGRRKRRQKAFLKPYISSVQFSGKIPIKVRQSSSFSTLPDNSID